MQPTYEIKNVRTWDTYDGGGFSATIYRDGHKVGTVENTGTGGSNDYWWDNSDWSQDQAIHAAAVAAGHTGLGEKYNNAEAEDELIDDLLEKYEVTKTLMRVSRTKTVFLLEGEDPYEAVRTVGGNQDLPGVASYLARKYGEDKVQIWDRRQKCWTPCAAILRRGS